MDKFNPQIHHRRSIRLNDWDYGWGGWYYITICAHKMRAIFGDVVNDEMVLSDYGKVVQDEWVRTAAIRKEVELDEFQIMPNHFHGIIIMHHVGADGLPAGRHGVRPDSGNELPKLHRKQNHWVPSSLASSPLLQVIVSR